MIGIYYAICISSLVVFLIVGLAIRFKASDKVNIFLKASALVIACVLFVRYMTGRDAIVSVVNLQGADFFPSKAFAAVALFQVWLAYASEIFIILIPFFKIKTAPALVTFFCSLCFLINFAMLGNHITAIVGDISAFNYRAMLMAIETGFGLGFCVIYSLSHFKEILLKGKDWIWFALAVPAILFAALPSYMFQVLCYPYGYNPIDLNYYHRLLLYPSIIIPVVFFLSFKDKPYDTKRFALMYYAFSGLLYFSYYHKFADFFGPDWVTALPLHLCNTAMYITPLCLTFKFKKLFYFTYFINVLGAFFALIIPNYGGATIFENRVWMFYFNHYQAFFMPLLVVGLGIFPRPKRKEFKYSLIAFAVYFAAMLVINAWFGNYNENVDYFFINSGFIADKLGNWARNLRKIIFEFDIGSLHFKFYPLYQILFFIVYVGLSLGMWFIYELAYNVVSGWQDIGRRNKIIRADRLALEVKLNGRSTEEPINMENVNKLVLRNFTKRYGKSDVYAVKDANLEVNGGEIFGFLGPNGAGKSTIIKSIVGIQTITDGEIEVCGFDVGTQSVQAKRQIGFVPDHYALYERLTAREYINYIADLYDVGKEERDERLARFIKLFEFEAAIDNPIKTYSHGMKQR